jgi:AraC-like DNA-binding protein
MAIRMTSLQAYPAEMVRFTAEVLVAGILNLVRRFSARAMPVSVRFSYPAPPHRAEYERVFGEAIYFDQPVTEIVFERELLDVTSPHGDMDMHAALESVAERRLQRLTRSASHAMKVRTYLLEQSPKRASMNKVARALGLSSRSLRRQLRTEGTSYREIEYEVLQAVAKRLLCDVGLTIQETAHEMGFSRCRDLSPRVQDVDRRDAQRLPRQCTRVA